MKLAKMSEVHTAVEAEAVNQTRRRRKAAQADKPFALKQRYVYQAAVHLEETVARLWDFRLEADDVEHLDDRQDLTEALFHLIKARAYLNHVAVRRFLRKAIELEVYK